MDSGLIPVLWLCGPPGVGKSTVAWEVYRRTQDAAYVDIDQLGICFPAPADDPGRHRMKARNLAAVLPNYGAARVIVSGVVDPVAGVKVPGADLTLCRLRADRAVLAERLTGRGDDAVMVHEALCEAEALDRGDFADMCIDTTRLSIMDVVRLVCAL